MSVYAVRTTYQSGREHLGFASDDLEHARMICGVRLHVRSGEA